MSDQGDAGAWRPASHTGPYSEPDEPTGPLPAVSRDDGTPSAFPPLSAPPGDGRSADDDAPTGGFPDVAAVGEAPRPTWRDRSPFEPADPAAPPAQPWTADAEPSRLGASPPAPAGGPGAGGTPEFSFPPPGSDDEAGNGSMPPFGASAFPPAGAGHGSAALDAGPSQGSGTPPDAEKHYGLETSPGAVSASGTGSAGAGAATPRPAMPEPGDAPAAWSPGTWAEHPPVEEKAGASPSAWSEAPGAAGRTPPSSSGPDAPPVTPAAPVPPAAPGGTSPPAVEGRMGAPAFGSGAWNEPSPVTPPARTATSSGSDGRPEAWSSGSDERADSPAFGAAAWGEVPASGAGREDDASASSAGAWSDVPASGSDGRPEAWSSGSDERADSPAFGAAAWGEVPASGANEPDRPSASAPGESGSSAPSGPEAWTETPASSSGRHRAGPPDATPPFGAAIAPVDPYDARDAQHGYEVSDPAFGLGMPSSGSAGRRAAPGGGAAPGRDVPDVSSAWESPAYDGAHDTRDTADRPATSGAPAGRGMPAGDQARPRPSGPPGEPFAAEPSGAGFGGEPPLGGFSGGPSSGGARGGSADHDADHEFFGAGDDPATWGKVGVPSGPPPQPGKPSSGNLRLPDWMREESDGTPAASTGRSGDSAADAGEPAGSGGYAYGYEDDEGRSRVPLIAGLGVLVAGLVVAAGVYLFTGGGDDRPSPAAQVTPGRRGGAAAPKSAGAQQPPKVLPTFNGRHTRPVGRIVDQRAALSYPKLGRPWQMEPKNGQMAQLGFSAGQYAVTEKAGGQAKLWARLMSGPLGGADNGAYQGPETVQAAATRVAATYEGKLYGFKHHKKLLASQPLDVGGHAGWLVGYHLTYHRAATRATGELFTVAVVDTGRQTPGVLLMSVPDTGRALYPDVDYVVQSLKAR